MTGTLRELEHPTMKISEKLGTLLLRENPDGRRTVKKRVV